MKLLHFALSTLGYGETLIGMSLADQLKAAGVESHFVISPISERVLKRSGHSYTVIDESMGRLARLIVDDEVARFRPDALVLSDYFTFCGVFDRYFGLEPWFVEEYGLPIMPVDIWEWEHTDFTIDMCGNYQHEVSNRILDMDVHLRPAPLARLDDPGSKYGHPFRLWGEDEKVSRRTRSHLLTTFGLRPTDKLVLLTVAPWQQLPPENCREDVARMSAEVPRLLTAYLAQLPESTHFLVVGQVPEPLHALPPERLHVMPPCSPAQFSKLLGSADLLLSLNAGATTLARATLSDIPAMVLTNRFTIDGPASGQAAEEQLGTLTPTVRAWLAGAEPLWPFRMWPLGFHSFLQPLLTGNPYTETFAHAELLDEHAVVQGMERMLHDPATGRRYAKARAAYRQSFERHPDTCDVFAAAARRLGLTL